jgi:hypothetical protein
MQIEIFQISNVVYFRPPVFDVAFAVVKSIHVFQNYHLRGSEKDLESEENFDVSAIILRTKVVDDVEIVISC